MNKQNVLILAGVHGNEKSAQLLAIELLNLKLEFNNIEVEIIPVVNPTGSLNNVRDYVNKDTNDLNRINNYESKQDIRNTLDYKISNCDLLIDIHNSPNCSNFCLFDNIYDYSEEIRLLSPGNVEYVHWDSKSYVNKSMAKSKDKLAITYEFKGMLSDKGENYLIAKHNIISILYSYNSNVNRSSLDYTYIKHNVKTLCSAHGGFVEYSDKLNSIIKQGELICTVYHTVSGFTTCVDIVAPCELKIIGYENEYIEPGAIVALYIKDFKDVK